MCGTVRVVCIGIAPRILGLLLAILEHVVQLVSQGDEAVRGWRRQQDLLDAVVAAGVRLHVQRRRSEVRPLPLDVVKVAAALAARVRSTPLDDAITQQLRRLQR